MKITLEGEPSEIENFFKQYRSLSETSSIATAEASEPVATSEEIVAVEETVEEIVAIEEESVEDVVSDQPKVVAPVKKKFSRPRHNPPLRDQVVAFLATRKRATLGEIAKGTRLTSAQISPRLADLQREGTVANLTKRKTGNSFGLINIPEESEGTVVNLNAIRGNDLVVSEYLAILNALVDNPLCTLRVLAGNVNIPLDKVEDRCMALEDKGLIQLVTSGVEVSAIAVAPTRDTQLPQPHGLLSTRIVEMIKNHPGETAEQLSIRLGKAYTDVARRLYDLNKSEAYYVGGTKKAAWRWFLREEHKQVVTA